MRYTSLLGAYVTADDAMLLLKRGSHRWAVQKWMKANQK